jgi:hypothetical protein
MVCPPWNGVDTAGRPVCLDSFDTKTAGCNSAGDRVNVENALRPQYIEYVNLDAAGIRGGLQCDNQDCYQDTQCHQNTLKDVHNYTGQFGYNTGFSQNIFPNCMSCQNHPDQRQQASQNMRNAQTATEGAHTMRNRKASGFWY